MKFKKITAAAAAAIVAMSMMPAQLFAADKPEQLTVEKATQWAIAESDDLKSAEEDILASEVNLEKSKDNLYSSTDSEVIRTNSINIMRAERNISIAYERITVAKEKLPLTITAQFAAILAAEKDLELYDVSLEQAQRDHLINKTKSELGLISAVDFDKAKKTYDNLVSSREDKEKAIDEAYKALNTTVGRNANTRYELVLEDFEYNPLGSVNLTGHISQAVEDNISVKEADNNVAIEKYSYDTRSYSSTSTSKEEETEKHDYNDALRTYKKAVEAVEENVRGSYDQIIKYEKGYKAAIEDIEEAKTDLEILKTEFELGQSTQLEIDKSEFSILQQEEALRQLIINHALEVKAFRNPNFL